MDDLIKEFLVESNENLDRLDSELVKLETDPSSQELLSGIFRTTHPIKGTFRFLPSHKFRPPSPVTAQAAPAPPVRPEPIVPSAAAPEETLAAQYPQDDSRSRNAAAETIRVDVHLLDRLMNLVGELVLTRNQITQFSARQSDPTLTSSTQQLNLLTSELQGEVMKTRMQPISNVFDKFPRV